MKITDVITEAANSAQQAAKAIAMKKAGKNPKQGVAEGFSDVVKGIKRKVAGKEDPKEVEHTYGRIARSAIKHKTPDQAEKDIKRWEKVNKVVNKEGVAEGSLEEDKGMTGYNAFKREWRAKHGADAKVPAYDSKEYTSYVYRQNDKKQGLAEDSKEDMSKEAKAMASGKCPHCHGPVEKKEHPTLTQYHCAKCGIRASVGKQGVAEGSNDTIYPNAEVIKSKNGKPVGEIYQDGNSWGAFHYKADRGYDFIDSREEAIEALKDLHQETGRGRPDYTVKGVAEGSSESVSLRDMVDVVDRHYPKYYAELSGSDISDRQFERAIINAYKKIMQKQGVAEEASPMIKPPANRFDNKQEAFDYAKEHGGKVFKSTYIDPNTGIKNIIFVVKKEQGVVEGSGPKEKQKTPYRDINSPEYRAAADKQKQRMAKDKAAEPGKKLLAKKGVAEAYQFKGSFPFDVDHMPGQTLRPGESNKTSTYVVATNPIGSAEVHKVNVTAGSENEARNKAAEHFMKKGLEPRIDFDGVRVLKKDMAEDTELAEEFDLIESIVEMIAEHNGVDAEVVWADLESLTEDELYVFAVTSDPLMEDWQKANKRDKTDGMSQKAVNAYRRENPGSKLKTAVTTKPSKLKKGGKASKRRKSYCSRSRGQMKMHSISCAKTPDKAICKARRRWNC